MKNLKKILLFVLILMGSDVIEASNQIRVKIVYGKPRENICRGLGICYMIVTVDDPPSLERETDAVANLNSEKRLVLTLKKKEMLPETFAKYFSKGTFICEDDFRVPGEVLKALNYYSTYTIKAGEYPVEIKEDAITVVF